MNAKTTTDTQTDWDRLSRRDDNEIDYSDTPTLSKSRKNLRVRLPNAPTILIEEENIKIDADVLAWFKSHESNYKESINQLLRDYITKK
ncbi:MAG: 3-oxoacyl-ACP synthase [Methylococcaceae bacterium]|nr:3-oxoacyl-ACP synthase [Methylococcaceae bacterium]